LTYIGHIDIINLEKVNMAHISLIIWLGRLYKMTLNHLAMSESVPRVPEISWD